MKKMAFVDLTNYRDWPTGGMLQYELAILPHLSKAYDLDIWGVSVDGDINKEIILADKKFTINIFGNVKTGKRVIPNYWRGLQIYLQKKSFYNSYDVIYVHTGSCAAALSSMIDRNSTKLVYHQHGLSHLHDYALISLIQRPFVNYAQYKADLVFIVSDEEAVTLYTEKMSKKCETKFLAVKSPIDLALFDINERRRNISSKKNITGIIYTGRLDAHKDPGMLIDMFHIYHEHNKNAILTIVGGGEKRKEVEQKINEYDLKNYVVISGELPREQVLDKLKLNDVYVTASIGEGVSVSVLEAYATGLPVIAFDVPGLSKQVIDGVTGYIVKERTPEDMAKALMKMEHSLQKLSVNCLDHVEAYNATTISRYIIDKIAEQLK